MGDKYAGWTEVPADKHAGWTEVPADKPVEQPSRLARLAGAIKRAPGEALRLKLKADAYGMNAVMHPIDTFKDLTDFSSEGTGGAVVRGFGKGASAGFIDELDGAVGAVKELGQTMMDPEGGPLAKRTKPGAAPLGNDAVIEAYRAHRDQRRHDDAVSQQASPDAFGTSQFVGAATMPTAKAGLAGRLAQGAIQGGAFGLGGSEADLTKGQTGPALRDTGEGAAMGFAATGALEPVMAAGRYSQSLMSKARGAEEAAVQKAATKDFGSERSGLASDSGAVNRRLDVADKVLADTSGVATPEMKAKAKAFIESELGINTRRLTMQNALDELPRGMGQMQERRAAMEAAAAAAEPDAVNATAQQNLDKSVFKEQILPRADRLAHNAAMSVIGAPIGGAPVKTLTNLLSSPHTQYRAGQIGAAMSAPVSAAGQAIRNPATQMLDDYLRPKDDEERQKEEADRFTSGTGR